MTAKILAKFLAAASAALLSATLLAGCAAKKPEPAPVAAAEPAAPAVEPGVVPSAQAKPILLSSEVLPEGGVLEQGTLVTGKSGWAAHGEMEGAAWRFGSMDAGRLRVAGKPGTEWSLIQVAESWGVRCFVEADKSTPCLITRVQPVTPGSLISGGLALDAHTTCVRADDTSQDATVAVGANAPVTMPAGSLCIGGPASDALQQQMLGADDATIWASFTAKGKPQTLDLPTAGLKQALAMRAWILEQFAAGKLQAEP
jgi:hypothetical protein